MIVFQYNSEEYLISYHSVSHYLDDNGWKFKKSFSNGKLFFHELGDSHEITVLLPDKDSKVLNYQLLHLFKTLSEFENRSISEIISSIKNVNKDILKISLSKGSMIDSLKLNDVEDILKNIKKLILYSASAEVSTQPYFERPFQSSVDLVRRCSFGHTFKGSFGFTIENPVYENKLESESDVISAKPFSRKVSERIIRTFKIIEEADIDKDIEEIYKLGPNANTCESIKKLLKMSRGDIECSVICSPLSNVSSTNEYSSVCLSHSKIEYLDFIYEKLKEKYNSRNVSLIAKIMSLKIDPEKEDHTIVLLGDVGEEKEIKIHVVLTSEDYKGACNLHRDEKQIKINGYLNKFGNKWYLESYDGFEAVDGSFRGTDEKEKEEKEPIYQKNLFDF